MFYGSQVWDPLLIVAQIVTTQCLFYISYGLLLWILVGPYVSGHLTLAHFFGAGWMGFHSFVSWMAILANIFNALPVSLAILLVVERAKKCLDFAATAYLLHLAAAAILGGFPTTPAWWFANCVAFAITAVLSEWLCLQRELREIPIGRRAAPKGAELMPLNAIQIQGEGGPGSVGSSLEGGGKPSLLQSRLGPLVGSRSPSNARDSSLGRAAAPPP